MVGTTCPATLRFIDVGDAQVRSNPAFRNGNVYYSQTVGIPAGGLTHTAAQWTVVNATTAVFVDGGRVEDPTATNANGGKWYAYSSITANKNGDIMLGFSQFASNQFASAGYAFRLATDAAGTMRDPFIYKTGEDYYAKTFSGTRNRWGDYSHTLVDPVTDRDMWTLQEYAGTRIVADANSVTNNSRWATWWAKVSVPAGAGVSGFSGSDLLISEFRVRGPNGATDEFVEIYNNTIGPLTVLTLDGSSGYGVAASDGVIRCTIPNATTIPSRGHYLCVNSVGYSLASYPAGNATTATGNATYTTDIPDNAGIALFNSATVANFSTTTRLDAVGSTSEANTLYKEGTGYPALTVNPAEYSLYRDLCALNAGKCTIATPKDTDNNANDFFFVDTQGAPTPAGQRLGAPGPENLSSPIYTPAAATLSVLDTTKATGVVPNFVRDFTSDPGNNSTFGTISLRRRLANTSGESITRLRFRVIDITTFPASAGTADLRPRTSPTIVVGGVNDPATCGVLPTPCAVTVEGTTLEQPPSQPNGGGFNSSLSAGTVTLGAPLLTGTSVNLHLLLGVQAGGNVRFAIVTEGLTTSGRGVAAGVDYYVGTDAGGAPTAAPATISGRVTTSDGVPLAGVTMNLSGARSARTITDANGNYRFTNVDTDNFYTVAPSLVNHHFNPPAQSFSLLANKTDATFTATRAGVITGNAIDTSGFFVRQHYLDFLGREPDESGFNFWSDQIGSCGSDAGCLERKTINVSAAYFLSIEFQQTGGLVDGLYRASYGRRPLYAEFTPDAQTVARNVEVGTTDWAQTLEANKHAFIAAWVQRADFRAAYDGLTNAAYIDRLIANTRVTLSAAERDALLTGLNSGAITRSVALRRITEDERFVNAKRNEMFVMMEYFGYLRRDPDDSGYQFWLNKLNQFDGNFEQAEMVKAFINSGEYRNRFR